MEHIAPPPNRYRSFWDIKRGDIGSTAQQYAKGIQARYGADAVTRSLLNFHGFDSIRPYPRLPTPARGLSSLSPHLNPVVTTPQNQRLVSIEGQPLMYEHIAKLAQGPGT